MTITTQYLCSCVFKYSCQWQARANGRTAVSALVMLAFSFDSPCSADELGKTLEAIQRSGGQVAKDSNGNVRSLFFYEKLGTNLNKSLELIDLDALEHVRSLTIWATELTDKSAARLEALSTLKDVNFIGTKMSEATLARFLLTHRSIYSISFKKVSITGTVMPDFRVLDDLRMLALSEMKISNKGVKEIAKLQGIVFLDLSGTDVTDEDMAEVAKMKRLQFLDIKKTKIADNGVRELSKLTGLRELAISPEVVTDEGIRILQQELPNLRIVKVASKSRR